MADHGPLAAALADEFTAVELGLIHDYISLREREARATMRRDAAAALERLDQAVTAAQRQGE